jgi:putative transcriptional regulator
MSGPIDRPIDVVRILRANGLRLKKAHEALESLAQGKRVAISVEQDCIDQFVPRLGDLGVSAHRISAPSVDVQMLRQKFGLSQADFSRRFGFSLDALQNWEQGRNVPEGPARTLLKIIERHPEVVDEALTGVE